MKKTLLSLAVICFLATSVFAQKKIKGEGFVKYEITDVQSDDAMAGMMKGSTMEMYITKKNQRTTINMMGGMMVMDMIMIGDEDPVMLMDMMGNKIKMAEPEEDAKAEAETTVEASGMTYKQNKKKTKEIAGYKCFQVIGKDKSGQEMTFYVTDKISLTPEGSGMTGAIEYDKIGGFPLEFTVGMGKESMTFTAKKVSGDISKDAFEYSEEGYEEMSPEELGSMGQGLGF